MCQGRRWTGSEKELKGEGRDLMETDLIYRRAVVTNLPGDKDVLSATNAMSKRRQQISDKANANVLHVM